MKYSIQGYISPEHASDIVSMVNQYQLWRLFTKQITEKGTNLPIFTFEAWLDSKEDKDSLFNNLKSFVSKPNELINWHECTHDEDKPSPCNIVEEYRGD